MAPTVHLIRHAQGVHNLSFANHGIHDPNLTDFGLTQCRELSKRFPYHDRIRLVIASPLKRTIYTALHTFDLDNSDTLKQTKSGKVIAVPELQETSDLPCDTGSSIKVLEKEFSGLPVDLSAVESAPDWNSKKGKWRPMASIIEKRAKLARNILRDAIKDFGDDEHVTVVSHGGYLHYLTEDWSGSEKYTGTGWENCEFRSYTIDPSSGDNATLVETEESRQRRVGSEKPLTADEQIQLKRTALNHWGEAGLQKEDVKEELQQDIPVEVKA